jgi:hypothetical protein
MGTDSVCSTHTHIYTHGGRYACVCHAHAETAMRGLRVPDVSGRGFVRRAHRIALSVPALVHGRRFPRVTLRSVRGLHGA